MNEKKEIIIHVGFPHSASSFLQKTIFPKIKNGHFINGDQPLQKIPLIKGKINILSCEAWSYTYDKSLEYADRYEKILRISKLFPHAKIIIIRRDKEGFLKSAYSGYVKYGGTQPFEEWYNTIFVKENLDFDSFIKYLSKLFDKVLVLDFNDLKNNSKNFIRTMCEFMNAPIVNYSNKPVNVKLTDKQLERWRKFNKLFKSRYNNNGLIPHLLNPLIYYREIYINKKLLSKFL